MRADTFARALVRLYPRAWRRRYEDEFLALLEDSEASWRQAVDIAASLGREWRRTFAAIMMDQLYADGSNGRLGVFPSGAGQLLGAMALGAGLAVAGIPVAHWLNPLGWHPSRSLVFAFVIARVAGVFRGLPVLILMFMKRGEWAARMRVRRGELLAWAALVIVGSTLQQLEFLAPWNAASHFMPSPGEVALMGMNSLMMFSWATQGAIDRWNRLQRFKRPPPDVPSAPLGLA